MPPEAKICVQTCAECTDSGSSHTCRKFYLGICFPLIHSIVSIDSVNRHALRKHAYSNILKILPPKNENFQIKKSDIFQDSA